MKKNIYRCFKIFIVGFAIGFWEYEFNIPLFNLMSFIINALVCLSLFYYETRKKQVITLKYHQGKETYFWDRIDFRNGTLYTNTIQITLKDPWLLPKYEDDFAGIEGLRLYGWLFFYFGRFYKGLIYPALEGEEGNGFIDNDNKKWFFVGKDKIENFNSIIARLKHCKFNTLTYERHYNGEQYSVNVYCS